jgi:cell filamentation protein
MVERLTCGLGKGRMADRYTAAGSESEFELGSNDTVLKNKLGITSKDEMDEVEAVALTSAMDEAIQRFDRGYRFTSADICAFHRSWLGDIYAWAGTYRQVNLLKDDFPFAASREIPRLMAEFERTVLFRNTPCDFSSRTAVVHALAETHAELVLIHPFREGNGRVARALATVMALQADLPLLDFSVIATVKRNDYFRAVQASLDKNYAPMEAIFGTIIDQTLDGS